MMENEMKAFQSFTMPVFGLTNSAGFDFNRRMQLIAARYDAENRLLAALRNGDEEGTIVAFKAYGEMMNDADQEAFPTSADPVRDFKNSVLTINTLFRKAIEDSNVHPIYIHESSSYFGAAIESAETREELVSLILEMVKVYCRLVREYTLTPYSPIVRTALLYIDLNLASPISTKDIAKDQFLSPNYLSARFRQELGVSISDYLLNRRVRLAAQLLSTTQLSVQEIAAKTGIGDASYFSKQFKRVMGVSPHEYRKHNSHETRIPAGPLSS